MLTHRQQQTLLAIQAYQRDNGGVSPTVRDVAEAIGAAGQMNRTLGLRAGLEERGFIRRHPGRHRAIEVLRPIPIARVFRFNDATKSLEPLP